MRNLKYLKNNILSYLTKKTTSEYSGSVLFEREATIKLEPQSGTETLNRSRINFYVDNARTANGSTKHYSATHYVDRLGFHGPTYGDHHINSSWITDSSGIEKQGITAYNIRVDVLTGGDYMSGTYNVNIINGIITEFTKV